MKKSVLKILPAALLAAACAHSPEQRSFRASPPEPLAAEGSAPLDERNIASSRERASIEAERAAVRRAAALFMDETALAEGQAVLEIGLLKTPQLYVAKRKVLSEGRDGALYRVSLKAWISQDKVVSALRGMKLAGPGAAGPSAALVQRGQGGKAFAEAFRGAFGRLSSVQLKDFPFASDPALLAGTDRALAEAAGNSGAELLFVVSASASSSGAGFNTGFHPSRSEASLKVYRAGDGEELLSISSQANAIDPSEAVSLSKALASAGELLAQEAAGKADRLVKAPAPVRIKILGVDGLETLEKLVAQLRGEELSGLRAESYGDSTAVLLAVPASRDLHEFASALLREDTFGLELEGVGPQEIVFSMPR